MDNDAPKPPQSTSSWQVILVMIVWLIAGVSAYTAYRVVTFTDSVFGGSSAPEPPVALAPTPTALPPIARQPAVKPAAAPAANPAQPAPTPTVVTAAATAEIGPTSRLVERMRSGQRTSFVLIGYGGPGHDGPYLTDALVVGSYDPTTGVLALFNLPRDLWVQVPLANGKPGTYRRINEVFGLGLPATVMSGAAEPSVSEIDRAAWQTAKVAEQVLGLPIHGWVTGDFIAVRQVIDGLGGVTVDVEKAFDDFNYPRHDNAAVDAGVMHVHFDAGPQRLSGERALQYVRSRYGAQDGSDFGRSRRQQRLLLALKDQILSPATLPKVFTLMSAVQGHLRTSLSVTDARALLFYGRDHNVGVRPVPIVLDTDNLLQLATTQGGASILVPRAGYGNYTGIHRFVQGALSRPPGEPGSRSSTASR